MGEPGDLVADRYRLVELIGSGSMGRVWLARDEVLQRSVALKEVIAPHWMPDAERATLRADAVREARIAARLTHRHVVAVFDVLCEADRPWIVMEYVPSRSLDAVVADAGPMTPGAAAVMGLALVSALAAAHRAGVLHRDVKPQNVLIGDDGRVVLTDFGVAVVYGTAAVTRTDVVVGTPQYVAPERARHGVSTAAADLWSLGATLYAAVEGRPPYSRETALDTLAALAASDPDPMVLAGPLRPVIEGLLQRDPDARATVADTQRMLRAASGSDAAFRRPPPSPPLSPILSTRNRIGVAAAAAVLLAAVGAAAYAGNGPSALFEPGRATPACAAASSEPAGRDDVVAGPTALPSGWRWYADPAGFQVGVPLGWTRGVDHEDGDAVCFRDPDGTRSLMIATAAPMTDPVGYWQTEERRLADRDGYRNIGIEPVIYQRGGADWTYTLGSEQTLRRLFTASNGAGFSLAWTTRDYEWALNEPNFRVVTASFTAG